jgi:hypothetical protein
MGVLGATDRQKAHEAIRLQCSSGNRGANAPTPNLSPIEGERG